VKIYRERYQTIAVYRIIFSGQSFIA